MGYKTEYQDKEKPLCGCGCGLHVSKPTSRFKQGHYIRSEEWRRKNSERQKQASVINICEQCGIQFICKKNHRRHLRFCSRKCSQQARMQRLQRVCLNCKKAFSITPYHASKSPTAGKFCSMQCKLEYWARERRTNPKRCTQYRITAREDHGQQCSKCGYSKYPKVLVVHHIDENREDNHPDNLTVLCPTCHAEAHLLNGNQKLGPTVRVK